MRKRVAPGGVGSGSAVRARLRPESVDSAGARRQPPVVGQRGDAVAVGHRSAGPEALFRRPRSHDIIVGFVLGRQFDELDAALAPALARLDPVGRPQFIGEFEVLIVVECAVALDEAEAARIVVDKGGDGRDGQGC